jgi:hypothetical protein
VAESCPRQSPGTSISAYSATENSLSAPRTQAHVSITFQLSPFDKLRAGSAGLDVEMVVLKSSFSLKDKQPERGDLRSGCL